MIDSPTALIYLDANSLELYLADADGSESLEFPKEVVSKKKILDKEKDRKSVV